jgi:hypothetical protein
MKIDRPEAPKSIPRAKNIATLLALTSVGSNIAATNQSATRFDFENDASILYHEGLVKIQVTTVGGVGVTPTAVGAGVTLTLKYAWSDDLLDLNDAVNILQPSAQSLVCALPNAISVQATGVLTISSAPTAGEKVLISDGVSTYPYYWVASGPNDQPFNVVVGAGAANAALHLIDAINHTFYPSSAYSTGLLTANTLVTAATGGAGVVNLTAINYGAVGNTITTTETGANTAFGAGTLTGGSSAGSRQYITSELIHGGRYLYVWYDRDAFAIDALVNVTAKLIRL